MAPKLTPKQLKFIDKYLETGNGTRSALEVYNTSNYNSAHAIGSENLQKPAIQQYILQRRLENMDSKGLTKDWIIDKIIAEVDEKNPRQGSNRLKALELLGRTMALYKDQQQVSVTATVPKSIQELDDEYKALIGSKTIDAQVLASHTNTAPEEKTGVGGEEPEPLGENEHG